ncbi:deaminase domain-containing protein [Pigmentibacter ruber]
MKLIKLKQFVIISSFFFHNLSFASVAECKNQTNSYILNFKKHKEIIVDTKDQNYLVFKDAHEFLNKVILKYELFSSNDFYLNKYNNYISRAVSAANSVEMLKKNLSNQTIQFPADAKFNTSAHVLMGKVYDKISHNLIDKINYLKLNSEKFKLLYDLSIEKENKRVSKEKFDAARVTEEKGSPKLEAIKKEMSLKDEAIKNILQNLNKLENKKISDTDKVIDNDFTYTINNEEISYTDLPKMTDSSKINMLLNSIDNDLRLILFKNITNSKDLDINDRTNFLNGTKTFSYAEFIPSRGDIKKYYSISGLNLKFKAPTLELRQKIQSKIYSDEYSNKDTLHERINLIDKILNEKLILVNQTDKYLIPALNTERRHIGLKKNELQSSNDFQLFKELPINKGKNVDDILDEFYDLKTFENLGESSLKQFKEKRFQFDKNARISDAEYKILNQFLAETQTNPNIEGNLTVYTSKPACHSCITGYESFQEQRPKIELKIITLTADLEKELKLNYLKGLPQ